MSEVNPQDLIILAFHYVSHPFGKDPSWRAVAVFTKKPEVKDILALGSFNDSALDNAIAERLVEHEYCAIFGGERGKEFEENPDTHLPAFVAEYMFIHPQPSGYFNLGDYLFTGYCDSPEAIKHESVYTRDYGK